MQFGNPSKEAVGIWKWPNMPVTTRGIVRLVRGSKLSSVTRNADGTSTQHKAGLMWQTCLLGQTWDGVNCNGTATTFYTWSDGVKAERAGQFKINFAGYNDWRLPKFNELEAIGVDALYFLNEKAYLNPNLLINNPDYSNALIGLFIHNYSVMLVRNLTAPASTTISIQGNTSNSMRNSTKLSAEIAGPASTNAVYVWASVQALGEFCYSPASGWTLPIIDVAGGSLASGKNAHCQEPAGFLNNSASGASASIDILNGADLSAADFDKSRIFVSLEPAGSNPTTATKNTKVFEIGGSDW